MIAKLRRGGSVGKSLRDEWGIVQDQRPAVPGRSPALRAGRRHRPATGYISGLIRPVSLSKSSGRSASGNTSAHAGMVVPDRIAGIEVLVNVSFDILVRLMLKRGAGQDGRRVSAASRIGRGWRASTKMCVVGNGC